MSINISMDKYIELHSHNGILYSNENDLQRSINKNLILCSSETMFGGQRRFIAKSYDAKRVAML